MKTQYIDYTNLRKMYPGQERIISKIESFLGQEPFDFCEYVWHLTIFAQELQLSQNVIIPLSSFCESISTGTDVNFKMRLFYNSIISLQHFVSNTMITGYATIFSYSITYKGIYENFVNIPLDPYHKDIAKKELDFKNYFFERQVCYTINFKELFWQMQTWTQEPDIAVGLDKLYQLTTMNDSSLFSNVQDYCAINPEWSSNKILCIKSFLDKNPEISQIILKEIQSFEDTNNRHFLKIWTIRSLPGANIELYKQILSNIEASIYRSANSLSRPSASSPSSYKANQCAIDAHGPALAPSVFNAPTPHVNFMVEHSSPRCESSSPRVESSSLRVEPSYPMVGHAFLMVEPSSPMVATIALNQASRGSHVKAQDDSPSSSHSITDVANALGIYSLDLVKLKFDRETIRLADPKSKEELKGLISIFNGRTLQELEAISKSSSKDQMENKKNLMQVTEAIMCITTNAILSMYSHNQIRASKVSGSFEKLKYDLMEFSNRSIVAHALKALKAERTDSLHINQTKIQKKTCKVKIFYYYKILSLLNFFNSELSNHGLSDHNYTLNLKSFRVRSVLNTTNLDLANRPYHSAFNVQGLQFKQYVRFWHIVHTIDFNKLLEHWQSNDENIPRFESIPKGLDFLYQLFTIWPKGYNVMSIEPKSIAIFPKQCECIKLFLNKNLNVKTEMINALKHKRSLTFGTLLSSVINLRVLARNYIPTIYDSMMRRMIQNLDLIFSPEEAENIRSQINWRPSYGMRLGTSNLPNANPCPRSGPQYVMSGAQSSAAAGEQVQDSCASRDSDTESEVSNGTKSAAHALTTIAFAGRLKRTASEANLGEEAAPKKSR
jgi:hypothetical protein